MALIIPAIFLSAFCTKAGAETFKPFTLEDGHTLRENEGAVGFFGGYPQSGIAYTAAPWKFINLGFRLEAAYEPTFTAGAPWKFQLLETEEEELNFSLTALPGVVFRFMEDHSLVFALIRPGFAAGWRFFAGNTLFLAGEYPLFAPVSEDAEFMHYPTAAAGFEIPLTIFMNLVLKGNVEFVGYRPEEFIYGGSLGFGFALWR